MNRQIKIFDTTLRDGEQSPGCSMNIHEKLEIAKHLECLKVDVIEAGFAMASKEDFEAIKTIAKSIKGSSVAALARTLSKDVDAAWEAVKSAKQPRIHIFIATSDIHMRHKLKKTREQVLKDVGQIVKYAKKYCSDIEFSAEDATRSDPEFLYKVFETAIRSGATVINVPDTVGYTTPDEFYSLITKIRENVSNIDETTISVHCHDDLGMAVANTLSAVRAGATQLECTINGIGERAGNAALEEVVMALDTRKDLFGLTSNVDTTQIYRSSKLVSALLGTAIPPNKAIVGANAFAHEAGIHQHGVLSEKSTYEIMRPESIGLSENKIVLGKHSGRHAFDARVRELGYNLTKSELNRTFVRFKDLAGKKKVVSNLDIEALIQSKYTEVTGIYRLDRFIVNSGNTITSTASIKMINGDMAKEEVATGDGPMDAAFKAIEKIIGTSFMLEDYSVHSVTSGKDAQGEVIVKLRKNDNIVVGRGLSTDIVEAGIKAYLNAVNKMLSGATTQEEDTNAKKTDNF